MWASGHDNKAFFEMLLERDDIQPNAAGKDGQTPLNLKRQTPTKNTTLLLSVDGYQGKGEGGYQGNLCHGLVRVEKENRLIRLFHNAAKDTFQDCLLDMFPRPHSHLAEVCIAHLSNCGFQGTKLKSIEDLESTLRGDSLLAIAYSYNAWASHSREPEDITSFSDRLAEFVAGCHAFPVAICEDRQFEVLGPLHVFAFFDLPIALAGPKAAYNSNIQTRTKGLTSLSLACYARSTWAVDELLGLHAVLVNQPANDGCTPLQWGSWRDYKEVVKELLVHRETQVNLTNKTGQTPLALASRELQYQAQGSQMIARYDAKATKGEQDIGQHHGQLFKRAVAWGNAREMWSDTALTQCSKGQPEFYEKLAASELKFFVTPDTSRTVEAHVPEVHRVIILAQERDLDIHIDKEIRCSSLLAALEKGRSEIVASLKEKASGMFLHASLQLEALQRLTNMQDVREILIMFPAGIEDLNLRTRMGHWVASQMISKVSLPKENPLWVIPGAWSLTGDEWRHPLATSPETDGLDSSQQEILVGLGVGLMTVEDTPLSPLVCYTSKGNHGRLITETFPRPHVSLSAVFSDQLTDIRPRRAPALESSFPST
ncbi:hypothetical protein BKA70DRAFT_1255201 [Coprinopsis sp. MPI-PUGE-AT-0042]|nr:hypothetical protein BKA70DRAFT_1255201 [Coprinopsis sp. MPI-PUGE-AT-0042]